MTAATLNSTIATSQPPVLTEPEVIITRTFDAPRELVFQAWTNAAYLQRWYAPPGCTLSLCQLDFRPGGTIRTGLIVPNGQICWCKGSYLEIIEPERIVFTIAMADEDGNLVESAQTGKDDDWPSETVVTVTFDTYESDKTKLTLHQTVSEAVAKRTGAHPSWIAMLDRLADELPTF